MKYLKLNKLSKAQLVAVSEIARDGAQIIFAALVINQIISGLENLDLLSFIWGLIICVSLWILSVIILKK